MPWLEKTLRILTRVLYLALILCARLVDSQCAVDVVTVRGRVEGAPGDAVVRVQLVYTGGVSGESAEATLDGEQFRIQIPFLTKRPTRIDGPFSPRCDRKPTNVLVMLKREDSELDRVSLNFPRDFEIADASAFTARSKIVLHGAGSPPVH
jgi:hypothetical protein